MKRILDCQASDFATMPAKDLKIAIQAAEGRTILSECIVSWTPLLRDVSNPEVARAFGADLLLLNLFDTDTPLVSGLPQASGTEVVRELKRLTGRPVGLNLEPVDMDAAVIGENIEVPAGRRLTQASIRKSMEFGFDFVCLTGNPSTGVSNAEISRGIRLVRATVGDKLLLMAGKMHAAGLRERWTETNLAQLAKEFAEAGADVVLLPAPGTVPGVDYPMLRKAVDTAHDLGALVMLAVGTSQEGADSRTVSEIALQSKMTGADIFHLGDAGALGIAHPENILSASITLRGQRHAWRRMAASLMR